MKKSISILLIAVFAIALLFGCQKRTALTTEEFKEKSVSYGLTVKDVKDSYQEEIFTNATMAVSSEGWNVLFLEINTEENAKSYWAVCVPFLENLKTGAGTAQKTDHDDFKMYTHTNGGKYAYVSQIGKTLVYIVAEEKDKASISAFIKSIGY